MFLMHEETIRVARPVGSTKHDIFFSHKYLLKEPKINQELLHCDKAEEGFLGINQIYPASLHLPNP